MENCKTENDGGMVNDINEAYDKICSSLDLVRDGVKCENAESKTILIREALEKGAAVAAILHGVLSRLGIEFVLTDDNRTLVRGAKF